MIFLVERMTLAFIDAYRGKAFVGLKWPKMLLKCKGLYAVPEKLDVQECLFVQEAGT